MSKQHARLQWFNRVIHQHEYFTLKIDENSPACIAWRNVSDHEHMGSILQAYNSRRMEKHLISKVTSL